MKTNSNKLGEVPPGNSDVVTRQMVAKRAREVAVINGRKAHAATEADFAEAERELRGQSDLDPKTEVLEAAPESERWDPLPGSTGHKVPAKPIEDEDAEGRSEGERPVDKGVGDAEHDQMLQAGQEEEKE